MVNLRQYLIDKHGARKSRILTSPDEFSLPTCPECGKGDEHFNFNIRTKRGGCFKCACGFDQYELLAKLENISYEKAREFILYGDIGGSKLDMVEAILNKNIEIEESKITDHVNSELPEGFELIVDNLRNPIVKIPSSIQKRNFPLHILKKFQIGFCNSGDYKSRIIFPLYTKDKKSFIARRHFDWMEKKYKNPPLSKHSQLLYGYHLIPKGVNRLFTVEGPTSTLRMFSRGEYAVGTCGKKISMEQVDLICELEPKEVISLFDGDALKQNIMAFNKLSMRIKSSYIILPKKLDSDSYYDPDDIPENLFWKCYENRIGGTKLEMVEQLLK